VTSILITGVAGFVGSNLAKSLLKDGYEVIGVDNLSSGTEDNIPDGVSFYKYDITYTKLALESLFKYFKFDTVFHLAASTCLSACNENPELSVTNNVIGTLTMLMFCKQYNTRKLIYADTSAQYENEQYVLPAPSQDECGRDILQPKSVYGASKAAAFLLCRSYERMHNMNISYTRYGNVYGVCQDFRRVDAPVMSAFIKKYLDGKQPIIYGDGSKRRDFIYVDDVNDLNKFIMLSNTSAGKIYDVGTGKNYSIYDVGKIIAKAMGKQFNPVFEPNRDWEAQENLADIRAARELGWEPKVSLDVGIAKSIAYLTEKLCKFS